MRYTVESDCVTLFLLFPFSVLQKKEEEILTFFGLKAGENLAQGEKQKEVERHGSAQLWWKSRDVVSHSSHGRAALSHCGSAWPEHFTPPAQWARARTPLTNRWRHRPAPVSPLECWRCPYTVVGGRGQHDGAAPVSLWKMWALMKCGVIAFNSISSIHKSLSSTLAVSHRLNRGNQTQQNKLLK